MFEGDPTATTPMSPLAPPAPPVRKSSGIPAGRLVALGLLAFALAAFSGRIDLASLVSTARNYVDRAAPAVQTTTSSSDTAAVAAVKDVVQRANEAQEQAYARNDPTLMRSTATASYYQELVQTNQGLQQSGAQSIALTKLEWVDVTVSGTTATAVTNETWRTMYTDGSVGVHRSPGLVRHRGRRRAAHRHVHPFELRQRDRLGATLLQALVRLHELLVVGGGRGRAHQGGVVAGVGLLLGFVGALDH